MGFLHARVRGTVGVALALALVGAGGAVSVAAEEVEPGSISGTVHEPRLDGLKATLWAHGGGSGQVFSVPVQTVPVNPDGTYTLTGVEPNDSGWRPPGYTVAVSDTREELASTWAPDVVMSEFGLVTATSVKVLPGQAVTGVDVTLRKRMHVAGTAVGTDGTPLVGLEVRVFRDDHQYGSALTAADGTWRTGQLPEGDYQVLAVGLGVDRPSFWWGGNGTREEAGTVVVDDGDAHVAFVLPKAATLSGTVTRRGRSPLAAIAVTLHRLTSAGTWEAEGTVDTAEDGTWRYRGILPGTYRLRFSDLRGKYVDAAWGGGGTVGEGADLVLVEGQSLSGLDVELAPVPVEPPAVKPPAVKPPAVKSLTKLKAPRITGRAKVGRTLTVSRGSWKPAKVTVRHQWQSRKMTRKGAKVVPIAKATSSKLKLTRTLRGRKVRVRVTVSAPGHRTTVFTTAWTRKVA